MAVVVCSCCRHVAWEVVVLTLGAALPHWIVDDGFDYIPISMQSYATEARATALALWTSLLSEVHWFAWSA